ncbi:MAG: UDP-N-acetylmuramoyl-L-alanyl-D-glutamate--2,6-diaminopimelate ligase [endosymbiont of Escarpia spicata]|uniref:UDP-N-acetylmuramoyl-L-alanyl-D-glutamate--2,6-diaminopimelate ligase n=1 Tax=endosymbiont of Escarpia spicata TaxID=2200908 RepID=A0A370DSD3_9GAMM|nr:MAG: UDP-N-acetylmuramoyl-L-alanyl-D-glutamate--2,6-diaminopimelate ligase [endosymbiont of Escarpia spicata]
MTAHVNAQGILLSELLGGFVSVTPKEDRVVTNISLDSRFIEEGGLFLACLGGSVHGLDFADQAIGQGAAAIVWEPDGVVNERKAERLAAEVDIPLLRVENLARQASLLAARFYGYPSRSMTVIGITGTNGKTSVSHLLAQALEPDTPTGIIGTLGAGFAGALIDTGFTTPDAVTLQSLLAQLKTEGAKALVMEVSSHALAQDRTAAIHFDIAVFTNISRDHFDFHGTMSNYFAAKQRLFHMPDLCCAVINLDDPFGPELLDSLAADVDAVVYSVSPEACPPDGISGWIRAEVILPAADGMDIHFSSQWGRGVLHTSLMGRFNASNLLAALSVLLYKGWTLEQALAKLSKATTVEGRLERFGNDDRPCVVVDFAHTPDALENVLLAVRSHCASRMTIVFGCGGDRDRGKRPQMGRIAEQYADSIIVTDDNPRGEESRAIIDQILAGMEHPEQARVEANRAEAIRLAVLGAGAEDLVLVAGKGHETYQQIGDRKLPFSDREQVIQALDDWQDGGN